MDVNMCLKSLLRWITWSTLLTASQVKSLEGMETVANRAIPTSGSVQANCGRSRYHEDHKNYGYHGRVKRIVGGNVSQPGEWPWLVSLHLYRNDSNKTAPKFGHMCGGNLINRQWVLTAAHCFDKNLLDYLTDNIKMWKAIVGEHNMFEEDANQLEIKVEKIIMHPNWNVNTFNMDSALVKLASNVSLNNDSVNVVCLPSVEDDFPPGTKCVTVGWGHTTEGATNISDKVRHVVLPVYNNTLCKSNYKNFTADDGQTYSINITETMICAGYPAGGKDACQFDSGGPLVYYNSSEEKWKLVGTVSIAYGCARQGYPGIYSRVTKIIPWIKKTIAEN